MFPKEDKDIKRLAVTIAFLLALIGAFGYSLIYPYFIPQETSGIVIQIVTAFPIALLCSCVAVIFGAIVLSWFHRGDVDEVGWTMLTLGIMSSILIAWQFWYPNLVTKPDWFSFILAYVMATFFCWVFTAILISSTTEADQMQSFGASISICILTASAHPILATVIFSNTELGLWTLGAVGTFGLLIVGCCIGYVLFLIPSEQHSP